MGADWPSTFSKDHVADWNPSLVAVADEQCAVGINDEVGGAAPERVDRRDDAAIAAFDLDECPDWSFVDRDNHLVERKFLPVFLVAEPNTKSRAQQNRHQALTVFDARLELLAQFARRMLGWALERDVAVSILDPYAQHLSERTQRPLLGVEQYVGLQPPRTERFGASGRNGRTGRFSRFEPQLDLALERRRHGSSVTS